METFAGFFPVSTLLSAETARATATDYINLMAFGCGFAGQRFKPRCFQTISAPVFRQKHTTNNIMISSKDKKLFMAKKLHDAK